MRKRTIFYSFILMMLVVSLVHAQMNNFGTPEVKEPIVSAEIYLSENKLVADSTTQIAVMLNIDKDWHINSHQTSSDFLIPTEVSFNLPVVDITYPMHEMTKLPISDESIAVYSGKVTVFAELSVDIAPIGEYELITEIRYQGCSEDGQCSLPETVEVRKSVDVVESGVQVEKINSEIFSAAMVREAGEAPEIQDVEPDETVEDDRGQIEKWIAEKGWLLTMLLIFISGLALNLTPCVYPMISITVIYFADQAKGSIAKSLLLGVVYVLGMAFTYSVIGVIAALTGSMLGAALQNPFVIGFIVLVMLALASSMFGLYEFRAPTTLMQWAGVSHEGIFGTLLMGVTIGIIGAPCLGPFTLGLLLFVGESANPLLGFLVFFVFSIGLGLPYVFLGTFSGAMNKLPRSGEWMIWVKKIFGFILIALALYFARPLIPEIVYKWGNVAIALVAGIYLGFMEKSKARSSAFVWIKRIVGVFAILAAIYMAIPKAEQITVAWQDYEEKWIENAKQENLPVMIDFTADWCPSCRELEHYTFTDPNVIRLSQKFVTLKADMTKDNSPEVKTLREAYKIMGVPTIIFIDEKGIRRSDLRVVGFLEAEKLIQRMEKVLE